LPEAQVDRFLFKINVGYPTREDEKKIILNNNDVRSMADFKIGRVISISDLRRFQSCLHDVFSSDEIIRYIYNLVDATRNPKKYSIESGKYVRWGGSPRACISLSLAAKANALVNGRGYTLPDDVKSIAKNVLRHRMVLNYEGKAKNIQTDEIVDDIMGKVEVL
ncbi:MAG: AAA family ATPase, partial [Candidatus Aenigmatarchaeota archaeon]